MKLFKESWWKYDDYLEISNSSIRGQWIWINIRERVDEKKRD